MPSQSATTWQRTPETQRTRTSHRFTGLCHVVFRESAAWSWPIAMAWDRLDSRNTVRLCLAHWWKDTFVPAFLEQRAYAGRYYIMPHVFSLYGSRPQKTYGDLPVLREEIGEAGIAPLTCQEKYPGYMMVGYLMIPTLIVYLLPQRRITEGLAAGALKG